MHIQVLGSGCPACHKLFETTQKAVEELNIKEDIEYVTGDSATQKFIELGVLTSPVLLIDEKVVMTGATNNVDRVKHAIFKGIENKSKTCGCDCCCEDGCACDGKC